MQCASMVGAIDRVLGFTLEYSFDRYSFGRPLASYQALKHRFADLKLWTEACLGHVGRGGPTPWTAAPRRPTSWSSVAKSYIGDHAPAILQDCVQLHGGIGVTWDHDLHLYIRRVVEDRSLFGTPEEHRERIAHGDSDWRRRRRWRTDTAERQDDGGLESFRVRARAWLAANMPLLAGPDQFQLMADDEMGTRARELQRILFDGGFAGLYFPQGVRGPGARPRVSAGLHPGVGALRDAGRCSTCPTFAILPPTLLDFGTEEQKQAAHPQDPLRGGDVGAVPLRALGRLGSGRPGDPGHARR